MGSTRTIISKGSIKSTTVWIWALHADAHDFAAVTKTASHGAVGNKYELSRKVFASDLAHLSVVLFLDFRYAFSRSIFFKLFSMDKRTIFYFAYFSVCLGSCKSRWIKCRIRWISTRIIYN